MVAESYLNLCTEIPSNDDKSRDAAHKVRLPLPKDVTLSVQVLELSVFSTPRVLLRGSPPHLTPLHALRFQGKRPANA